MSYPRTRERIVALLPAILAKPEIADELEKKAIRRDVIEQETLEHVGEIWEAVSARAESYDLTEQTMATVQQRLQIPSPPSYLRWIHRVAWTLLVLMLISGVTITAFGLFKGWSVTAHSLTRFLTSRGWAFVVANLIVICGMLFAWHRRRERFFKASVQSAEEELAALLMPLKQQLEAEKILADESLDQAVISQVREVISRKRVNQFGTSLPDNDPDGLSQVQNPEFEITTPASDRLRRIIEAVRGASIGVSGPRGAGKTTLLWANYQIGNTKPNVLSIFTSAPVEYDAREFVLHLFASVCSRIIEKAVGRPDSLAKRRRRLHEDGKPYRSSISSLFGTLRPVFFLGMILVYASFILAYFKAEAARAASATPGTTQAIPFTRALLGAMDLSPGILLQWGVVLVALGFLARPYVSSWGRRMDRERSTLIGNPEDLEYERSLEEKGPLVLSAHYQLSNIRFQQSFTSGWSGSLKLPIALEGGVKSDRSWSERQRTLPDIVDDYRRFLDRVVGSQETPYERVLICIDELDKLESDEAAQRFLNGIKSVFNQARCYYLLSVSENAMSSFERRGLPIRDAFDSSFDEVIHLEYQSLASSKRLLSRRILNLPDPYLCFCHILAGGLPRDLIRVCRALFDARAVGTPNNLADICGNVIFADLQMKLRAIAVAAERELDLPKDFGSHLLACSPKSRAEIWALISALEADQFAAASKNAEPPKTPLPTEALLLAYFSVTVLEIFERIDEPWWQRGEKDGLFEELAVMRRSLSQNPALIAQSIAQIRSSFGLLPSRERLPDGCQTQN